MPTACELFGRASFAMQTALGIYSARRVDDIDDDIEDGSEHTDKSGTVAAPPSAGPSSASDRNGSPPGDCKKGREQCLTK